MNIDIWEQLIDETPKAYAAFVAYRDLGPQRSIHRAYIEFASKKGRKGGKAGASKAPSHWEEWSSKYDWVTRAEAWDDERRRLAEELHKQVLKERIEKMIEDEYADYEQELDRFRRVRDQTPIYEHEAMKETSKDGTDENGKPIKTITRVHTARLNVGAHRGLTRWRMHISALGRLNAGLPTSVTSSKVDAKVENVLTWKDAVEQARGNDSFEDTADAEEEDTESS
jgi:hypothetical protein